MSAMAFQITDDSIAYSNVCSGADHRKPQNCASLAFLRGINRWPMYSPHKGPVTRKMFPSDDVIMWYAIRPQLPISIGGDGRWGVVCESFYTSCNAPITSRDSECIQYIPWNVRKIMFCFVWCCLCHRSERINMILRADSRFAQSQWETAFLGNDVSHWLGASPELVLKLVPISCSVASLGLGQSYDYPCAQIVPIMCIFRWLYIIKIIQNHNFRLETGWITPVIPWSI